MLEKKHQYDIIVLFAVGACKNAKKKQSIEETNEKRNEMNIVDILTSEFNIKKWQVENTLALIDEGNTIPFIARYRKERTGSLTDEILRDLFERLTYLKNLEARKEQVMETIKEQGKLSEELKQRITKATTLVEVEDLYRPFKQKKRTRATIAKEKGLEAFALEILLQPTNTTIEEVAKKYINEKKEVKTVEEAIQGAKDIIAEQISDEPEYRKRLRQDLVATGNIETKTKTKESTVYDMYYAYDEAIKKIPGHRILAINRGEKEKILSVKLIHDAEKFMGICSRKMVKDEKTTFGMCIKEAIQDAYKRLIFPSVEREVRSELTEKAEDGAIKIFGKNLEQLLLQPPIIGKAVLSLDPAFRTGCKVAVIDAYGNVLDTTVIYPTPPVSKVIEAKKKLNGLLEKYPFELVAIGNGTASRETEEFVVNWMKEIESSLQYIIVNEAGASVYSASKLGTEEFPDYDVALRSAVSIGRRLQDPLAELVKIDPKSIGVGQYQHDMNQKKLSETLGGVVEATVNKVGIDLNTASPSLLQYVAGISKTISKNIVAYRDENGEFTSRKELLKVAKLGPKAYEQCAGFLRIRNGKNPLDNTGVHPESYKTTEKMLGTLNIKLTAEELADFPVVVKKMNVETVAKELEIGVPTLEDIIKELEKPGRDPRDSMPKPILRSDVLEMKDLKEGMILKGTVRNVIDFGAFVDIGVHQDGLVHISKICNRYIKHPLEVVAIGDVVDVQVVSVDIGKKRIALSMIIENK